MKANNNKSQVEASFLPKNTEKIRKIRRREGVKIFNINLIFITDETIYKLIKYPRARERVNR